MSSAVRMHWKAASYTSWEEAVEDMREGLTVRISCRPRGYTSHAQHQIRFAADGSVELLSHPGYEIDEPAELMLAALGNPMCACVATALYFPRRVPVEKKVPGGSQTLDGRLRVLYAAVAWAQESGTAWAADLTEEYLRYGVTPDTVTQWLEAGWDIADAVRFWAEWVPFELAEQWRAAGKVNAVAAKAAGVGQSPDDDQRWIDAGFKLAKAARWRKTSLSPQEAFEWEAWGGNPTEVARLRDLPAAMPGVNMAIIRDWCRAGVPANAYTLRTWLPAGDMAFAGEWAKAGINPPLARDYEAQNEWLLVPITPVQVDEFRRAGFPVKDPVLLAGALDRGITAALWRQAVKQPETLPETVITAACSTRTPEQRLNYRSYFIASDLAANTGGCARVLIGELAAASV